MAPRVRRTDEVAAQSRSGRRRWTFYQTINFALTPVLQTLSILKNTGLAPSEQQE